MNSPKKVCIFVDGENLRHSIGELFPHFRREEYLPKANWTEFFDWIASETGGENAERIRTYWYVVQNIDFYPSNLNALRKDDTQMESIFRKDPGATLYLEKAPNTQDRKKGLQNIVDKMEEREILMGKRFSGWTRMQDSISGAHMGIEFRRAGSIRYDLLTERLGKEKAVDVKLATDLIRFKDIYDIAVIVSGDQDYVPAVEAIKDVGKRVVAVTFKKENGTLLPGGAKRLNQTTDWALEIDHSILKSHLGL